MKFSATSAAHLEREAPLELMRADQGTLNRAILRVASEA